MLVLRGVTPVKDETRIAINMLVGIFKEEQPEITKTDTLHPQYKRQLKIKRDRKRNKSN